MSIFYSTTTNPQFILTLIANELPLLYELLAELNLNDNEDSEDWEGSGKLDHVISILSQHLQNSNLQPLLQFFSNGLPRENFSLPCLIKQLDRDILSWVH